MKRINFLHSTIAATILATGMFYYLSSGSNGQKTDELVLGHGEVATLKSVYARWLSSYDRAGGGVAQARLPLSLSSAVSHSRTRPRGVFELNLVDGSVTVTVKGLDQSGYDVWLVDNKPGDGRTLEPEAGDAMLKLGRLSHSPHSAILETRLTPDQLAGFTLDMVAITREDESPAKGVVLSGAPGLLQQIYYSNKSWAIAGLGSIQALAATERPTFGFLLPKAAYAGQDSARLADTLSAQIARGRDIFNNEIFGGNGRTCSTCHRPENNFTIDPKFIANLPKNDPLFVAEFNPKLRNLENPTLLRQLGLIQANVDGFDKPGVFRSVPHLLALNTSIMTELVGMGGEFADDAAFANALGWSGDGAPNSGSLREFTIGAIRQHMTKSMNRREGIDFRLPTEEEMIALEAFQLSLGRAKDYDLAQLTFTSPVVERGKVLFDSKQNPVVDGQVVQGETANCNGCHQNAGANSSTTHANPTRDTGVENMNDQSARLIVPSLPVDGGFGKEARDYCGPGKDTTCYGDGRFNTTTVIEAADTPPYFHNNSISTLEEAVAAYNGDGFNKSPGALTSSGKDRRIKIGSTQVVAVALFLRAINAVENIRSSNQLDRQAMGLTGPNAVEILKLAMNETGDAIRVLEEGVLLPYPEAVAKLKQALDAESMALRNPFLRKLLIQRAIDRKHEAQALIVTCDPSAVGPVTDPNLVFSCDELG